MEYWGYNEHVIYRERGKKEKGGRELGRGEQGRQADRQTNGVEEKNLTFGPNIH